MKTRVFAGRNRKEMLRDPLNISMGLGFPLVVMMLLHIISSNIPAEAQVGNPMASMALLSPGMAVFGLSFVSLFSAILISKDRSSSFLVRLLASPLTATDFILGYTLPMLPVAIGQSVVCFAAALCFGLSWTPRIFLCLLVLLPADVLFIAIGLLCGSIFTDKQVGGICGALLTNLSAWLSGTWFKVDMVGGVFETVAYALPFANAVDAARIALDPTYNDGQLLKPLLIVCAYAIGMFVLAVLAFRKKMKQ